MKIRKVASLFITLVLLLSALISPSVNADTISDEKLKVMIAAGEIPPYQSITEADVKIKKDAAAAIGKTILDDATAFEMSNAYLNEKWGMAANPAWSIEFMSKQGPGANASVIVDAATGEILSFNSWYYTNGQQNYIAKITRTEAAAVADQFIRSKLKLDTDSYEIQKEDPYTNNYKTGGVKEPVFYNFNYLRKINGIILGNDSIYVAVDGSNGKVNSFNRNYTGADPIKLPSEDGILSREQAMEKYRDSVSFGLQYITSYKSTPYSVAKPRVMLAYVPVQYSDMLDAVTGRPIGYDGSDITMEDQLQQLAITPQPLDPDAVITGKAISEAEAKALAETFKKVVEDLLDVKFDMNSNPQDMYSAVQAETWNYNWYKNSENMSYNFSLTISKATGHINNISIGKYDILYDKMMASGTRAPEVKEKISWTAGKEKALSLIKKLVPGQYGFYSDQNLKEPVYSEDVKKTLREHYYNFSRVVNGILFRDNSMGISIDRETGDVRNFYFNWNDFDFPEATGVISKEAAAEKYFDGTDLRLSYFQNRTFDKANGREIIDPQARLVYSIIRKGFQYNMGVFVDALSGKLLDWSGQEVVMKDLVADPALNNHWARRSVELLTGQGIIKNPYTVYDAKVTRAEAVKMLALAKGFQYYDGNPNQTESFTDVPKDSEYFVYADNAVKQKIITPGGKFNGADPITKEEFARLLVNMIGYSDIAGYDGIFKLEGIKAVDGKNIGYVAISKALGILPVDESGAYDGSGQLSYAEAAVALYKALTYIK